MRMKKHGKVWWIGWLIAGPILAVPVIYISIGLIWALIISPCKAYHARQQILASDPQTLLTACREMIANREKFRNDWAEDYGKNRGDRTLDRDKGAYGQDVPAIIRKMNPFHIVISKNRVLVFVYGPPRTGFIGYITGADELGMLNQNRATMITNGLWMFTN